MSGKIEMWDGMRQMVHPDRVLDERGLATLPAVEAIYGLTEGLSSRMVGALHERRARKGAGPSRMAGSGLAQAERLGRFPPRAQRPAPPRRRQGSHRGDAGALRPAAAACLRRAAGLPARSGAGSEPHAPPSGARERGRWQACGDGFAPCCLSASPARRRRLSRIFAAISSPTRRCCACCKAMWDRERPSWACWRWRAPSRPGGRPP